MNYPNQIIYDTQMLGFEKPLEGDYEIGRRRLEKEKKLRRGERERERVTYLGWAREIHRGDCEM